MFWGSLGKDFRTKSSRVLRAQRAVPVSQETELGSMNAEGNAGDGGLPCE